MRATMSGSRLGLALLAGLLGVALGILVAPALYPRPVVDASEGVVLYHVRDDDTGAPLSARLTFVGVNGTPNPVFTTTDVGREEDGRAVSVFNRVLAVGGDGRIEVPFGTYDVYVSHGPEWDREIVHELRVGTATTEFEARLERVIDTAGWLSGDFHVHSAKSWDSRVTLRDRVYQFVCDDIDMIGGTDHNTVTDYAPRIRELGLQAELLSAPGDEITTSHWGHFGAFPLPVAREEAGNGAMDAERPVREIFAEVRRRAPDALLTVHHPRLERSGFFDFAGLDAASDAAGPEYSPEFDAIEVLNGFQDTTGRTLPRVMQDWFELLNRGHRYAAVGNSDSHTLSMQLAGYPRNFVRVPDDRPDHVDPATVAAAVRAGHSFFSTGPFLRLVVADRAPDNLGEVAGPGMGDLVPAHGGRATVHLQVEAAPWINVDEVTLFVNGHVEATWAVPRRTGKLRLRAQHDLRLDRDAWVVLQARGRTALAPMIGDTGRYLVRAFAMSNPVYLDVDTNGRFDPLRPHGPHAQNSAAASAH